MHSRSVGKSGKPTLQGEIVRTKLAPKHRFQGHIFTLRRVEFYLEIGAGFRMVKMRKEKNGKGVVDYVDHMPS